MYFVLKSFNSFVFGKREFFVTKLIKLYNKKHTESSLFVICTYTYYIIYIYKCVPSVCTRQNVVAPPRV